MHAIESRLLVLSLKNKDHKTTTTTACTCRDKVSPQPQTERKDRAPKKNDKETNNDNELHVVADPQMPVCLTEFPLFSPASEKRPINCRNAEGQDDTEAPNTTNAPAAMPTSTENNEQDNNKKILLPNRRYVSVTCVFLLTIKLVGNWYLHRRIQIIMMSLSISLMTFLLLTVVILTRRQVPALIHGRRKCCSMKWQS